MPGEEVRYLEGPGSSSRGAERGQMASTTAEFWRVENGRVLVSQTDWKNIFWGKFSSVYPDCSMLTNDPLLSFDHFFFTLTCSYNNAKHIRATRGARKIPAITQKYTRTKEWKSEGRVYKLLTSDHLQFVVLLQRQRLCLFCSFGKVHVLLAIHSKHVRSGVLQKWGSGNGNFEISEANLCDFLNGTGMKQK